MKRGATALGALLAVASAACGTDVIDEHQSPIQRGRVLFSTPQSSAARDNGFACLTCHSARGGDPRILAGAVLGGATTRPAYWGGPVLDLLGAINTCRVTFMAAPAPWTDADADAKAMYAYLTSLPDVTTAAVPFTVARVVADVPTGDAERGRDAYQRACQTCHGLAHSAEARLQDSIPRLPEDPIAEHPASAGYTRATVRLVVIEKIRHGGFLGYGGRMPPFSTETLDDPKVGDILAYLGF